MHRVQSEAAHMQRKRQEESSREGIKGGKKRMEKEK